MIKFDRTIDFEIDKRARYENYYIIIVNNKFTNLRICYYFFEYIILILINILRRKLFITCTFFYI